MTTTERCGYGLGVWNPAGAQLHSYATETEREKARETFRASGFICWTCDNHTTQPSK